jgi:hypothetical protein
MRTAGSRSRLDEFRILPIVTARGDYATLSGFMVCFATSASVATNVAGSPLRTNARA